MAFTHQALANLGFICVMVMVVIIVMDKAGFELSFSVVKRYLPRIDFCGIWNDLRPKRRINPFKTRADMLGAELALRLQTYWGTAFAIQVNLTDLLESEEEWETYWADPEGVARAIQRYATHYDKAAYFEGLYPPRWGDKTGTLYWGELAP